MPTRRLAVGINPRSPAPPNTTRIERGFLGSNSDIGGGFLEGDLPKVALIWMRDQAKLAGIEIDNSPDRTLIANPVIHDKSTNLLTGQPTPASEDRDVRYADGGKVVKQRKTTDQGMTYMDTQKFIAYKPNPNTNDNISGTVDAAGYLVWLNSNGYKINMTVR